MIKKVWIVFVYPQVGSEAYNRGIKRSVWKVVTTRKEAQKSVDNLKDMGFKSIIDVIK